MAATRSRKHAEPGLEWRGSDFGGNPEELGYRSILVTAGYFADKFLRSSNGVLQYVDREDIVHELVGVACNLSGKYPEAGWEEFSRLFTVAASNHLNNFRTRVKFTKSLSMFHKETSDALMARYEAGGTVTPRVRMDAAQMEWAYERFRTLLAQYLQARVPEPYRTRIKVVLTAYTQGPEAMCDILRSLGYYPAHTSNRILLMRVKGETLGKYMRGFGDYIGADFTAEDVMELFAQAA